MVDKYAQTGLVAKVFLDSADLSEMIRLNDKVQGFTTNPTLIRKAGVKGYKSFAKIAIDRLPDKPISLEVIADDFGEMKRQAMELAKLGENVYVKIPITNTKGESSVSLIRELVNARVNVNVTAVMTLDQAKEVIPASPAIISIFAGRIADTQVDPYYLIYEASYLKRAETEILWASAREVFNVFQANQARADIITLGPDLVSKLDLKGKDLKQFSLETVRMFYDDAQKAGFSL